MTLLGNRVFVDVVKTRLYWVRVTSTFNHSFLYKERERDLGAQRHIQGEDGPKKMQTGIE